MKVSVVIPTKNGLPILEKTIAQVRRQDTPWEFEILTVDSGSRDGTAEWLAGQSDIRLIRIRPDEFGHGRTRNLALEHAKGKFAALITQDAMPADTTWLADLVAAGEQAEDIAGAFGRHLPYPDASPFTRRDLVAHFQGFADAPAVVRLDDRARYDQDPGYRQFLHFFSSNNALVRRSVWAQIPFPDVEFAEDQIWAQRIIEAGYAKAYAHDACVYHSHDHRGWEKLQRAFDESRSFRQLFGYRLCPSLAYLGYQTLACTYRDLRYLRRASSETQRARWALRAPIDHFLHQAGMYLGQRSQALPARVRLALSRDKRLERA